MSNAVLWICFDPSIVQSHRAFHVVDLARTASTLASLAPQSNWRMRIHCVLNSVENQINKTFPSNWQNTTSHHIILQQMICHIKISTDTQNVPARKFTHTPQIVHKKKTNTKNICQPKKNLSELISLECVRESFYYGKQIFIKNIWHKLCVGACKYK